MTWLRGSGLPRGLRAVALAAIWVFPLALPADAVARQSVSEHPRTQAPQTIQSHVRRVIVDVVVTDSQGKPVCGLSAGDFSVYEDGLQQRVLSFDAHSSASAGFVPPHLPPLPLNWFVNLPSGPERGPLFVVLLDLLHTDIDDQPRARKELEDFLAAKPEGERVAIFALTDTLHLVQGFTADRDRLLAAVSPGSSRLPHIFLDASNYRRYVSAPGALIDISQFLSGFPGRKNLIWIAGDFPYYMLVRPGLFGVGSLALMNPLAGEERKAAADALTRAQVSVYPVDAEGLVVYRDINESNSSHMFEDNVAEQTGGRAFYNSNAIATFLEDVADTDSNYYELTYSPPDASDQEKLRHIKVQLSQRGYYLAYRRSYYLGALDQSLPSVGKKEQELLAIPGVIQPDDSLYVYMQHGAPIAHDLLFSAHVQRLGDAYRPTAGQVSALAKQPAYFRGDGKKPDWRLSKVSLQTYAVDFHISAGQLPGTATGDPVTLELTVAVFDQDGAMLNSVVQKADTTRIPAERQELRVFSIREQIDVPSRASWLRFAIRDDSTGKIGATEIPLPISTASQ